MQAARCVPIRRAAAVLTVGAVAVFGAGCENAGQGALSGAALGAGAGAIIGSFSGNFGEGAAIGAVLGGVGGAVVGDQNRRQREWGSSPSYYGSYDYGYAQPYGAVYYDTTLYYRSGDHHHHVRHHHHGHGHGHGYRYSGSRYRY